jgi:hypothetical protein
MDMALHHSSTRHVCTRRILNTHFYLPPLGQVLCAALFLAQQIHTFDVNKQIYMMYLNFSTIGTLYRK